MNKPIIIFTIKLSQTGMLNDNDIEAIEMQSIYDFVTFKKCRRGLENYVNMCNSKLARSNVPCFSIVTCRKTDVFIPVW